METHAVCKSVEGVGNAGDAMKSPFALEVFRNVRQVCRNLAEICSGSNSHYVPLSALYGVRELPERIPRQERAVDATRSERGRKNLQNVVCGHFRH